eukprot:TRINITY_DN2264_c0_g1_i1.p2 TRINITY_DN2264_c0_g1~~TRINITY_DN2264_c0_g1_i1.p2  ORF type:complete len:137 (+),score=30.20 TRINITY_DN2264_c0_g1_i1:1356-1766(+)
MKKSKLTLLMLFIIILSGCNIAVYDKNELEEDLTKAVEMAYFEGQKDALNGIIRFKLNSDSVYVWTESCYDDGRKPIYHPTYLDSKQTSEIDCFEGKTVKYQYGEEPVILSDTVVVNAKHSDGSTTKEIKVLEVVK